LIWLTDYLGHNRRTLPDGGVRRLQLTQTSILSLLNGILMLTRPWFFPLVLLPLLLLTCSDVWAGGAPPTAVAKATYQISSAYKAMKILGSTVAMICAMIGSVKVYNKFQMADPDMYRSIFAWIFACLFCLYFPYFFDLLFR
jgi:hypothetical protein